MGDKLLYAGIDAGSRAIKVVLWDADARSVFASGVTDQGVAQESLAENLFNALLQEKRRDRDSVAKIVATGSPFGIRAFAPSRLCVIRILSIGLSRHRPVCSGGVDGCFELSI